MNLSAYPTLSTDYQGVARNYPTLHPTLEPTLYPTLESKKNHEFYEFLAGGRFVLLASKVCGLGLKNLWFMCRKYAL